MVSVLGMGGIGKSALAIRLMHQLADQFEVLIWRSLRDAPPFEAFLEDCLEALAPQPLGELPADLEGRFNLLVEYLVSRRTLLVFDNLEILLEDGVDTGRWCPGFEGYGKLLRRLAESEHPSCLLLTSREKPSDLIAYEGNLGPVHALRLAGLETSACQEILRERGVAGSAEDLEKLVGWYGGNPLALKIVAETIVELFGGEIAPFLEQGEVVFSSIRTLLDEQFARLSAEEQTVLLWLAILREPVSLEEAARGAGDASPAGPGPRGRGGAAPPLADRARAPSGEFHAAIGGAGICHRPAHRRGRPRDRSRAGSPG